MNMFSRFRVPADTHSVVIVSTASVATIVYTMWPWIQEQKQAKLENEHNHFLLLKATDPLAAQRHIESLKEQEWWISKQFRQAKEKHDVQAQLRDDYYDQRAQASYVAEAIVLPEQLFQKSPTSPTLHFPTPDEINAALLVGKSLDSPADLAASVVQSSAAANAVAEQELQKQQQKQRQPLVRGQAVLMSNPDDTKNGRVTLTTHFDFDALINQDENKAKV